MSTVQLLENPFLNAQEKALRITYIPDELKGIIFKEPSVSIRKPKKAAKKKRG